MFGRKGYRDRKRIRWDEIDYFANTIDTHHMERTTLLIFIHKLTVSPHACIMVIVYPHVRKFRDHRRTKRDITELPWQPATHSGRGISAVGSDTLCRGNLLQVIQLHVSCFVL